MRHLLLILSIVVLTLAMVIFARPEARAETPVVAMVENAIRSQCAASRCA